MKTIIAVVVATAITAGATFFYVANQKTAAFIEEKKAMEASYAEKVRSLEEDVRTAKRKAPQIQYQDVTNTVHVAVGKQDTPEEIIEALIQLKPMPGDDFSRTRRRIIHEFESLSDLGVSSLPAIQTFLNQNQDVEYERPPQPQQEEAPQVAAAGQPQGGVTPQGRGGDNNGGRGGDNNGGRGGFGGPGGPGGPGGFDRQALEDRFRSMRVRLPDADFDNPPSLRLGLMEVVKNMGGEQAEIILLSVLQTSARSIEVAYAVRVLEDMVPGKYRDLAISAAKDLLLNPVEMPDPSRYDRYGKTYLYAILDHFKDASFAGDARRLLVGADGNLDQTTLTYLSDILGENIVQTLVQTYMDPRLTNRFDKTRLVGMAAPYFGTNPQANQMFTSLMKDPEMDNRMKYMAVAGLDGGGFGGPGGGRNEAPTDPAVLQSRLALLDSVMSALQDDERMLQMAQRTYDNLQKLSLGEPIERSDRGRGGPPGGFGGFDRGGGGFDRGGGGGGSDRGGRSRGGN